jgi:hypothetical protein
VRAPQELDRIVFLRRLCHSRVLVKSPNRARDEKRATLMPRTGVGHSTIVA